MHRALLAIAFVLSLAGCATLPAEAPPRIAPVTVGIVAINDFHGALEPPKLSVSAPVPSGETVPVPAGGAAWLASAIDAIRAEYTNSVTVSAGDLIGASQVASSIYLDEPTIGVMNRIGLEFNAVGNHEFDSGRKELLRKQTGGCEKYTSREPCQLEPFPGAKFRFLAASTYTEDGHTLFPATGLKSFGSGKSKVVVGFIGLTLKGTDQLVSPDGIAGLKFGDEAAAINLAVPQLKAEGADAIVVLIHQGGKTSGQPDPNGCQALSGDILPILGKLDPRVDVVVSGHTHWAYVCDYGTIDPAHPLLLTSAGVYGELVTDITLKIDPATGKLLSKQARNVIVQSPAYSSGRGEVPNSAHFPQYQPRTDIAAYVSRYTDAAKEFADRVIGAIDQPAAKPGAQNSNTGGSLGNLIADAQLAATRGAGAQIAFMNPFGIRAPLQPTEDGSLTFGDIYKTQPFDNTLITQTLTGGDIKAMLEQGLDEDGPVQLLAPSAGFVYSYDLSKPAGSRIVGIEFDGKPLDMGAEYRVTTNSFLAGGGDGFTVLQAQRGAVVGVSDIDALEAWIKGNAPRKVPLEERVRDSAAQPSSA